MTTESELLTASKALLEMAESGVTSLGTIRLAREVIASAEFIGSVTATETVLDEEQVGKFRYYRFPTDEAMVRAIEQAVLQSPEVQRLRGDAEMYRKLRTGNVYERTGPMVVLCEDEHINSEDRTFWVLAGTALDAAMKEQP